VYITVYSILQCVLYVYMIFCYRW